jgi:putative RecB family exonuclease
VIAINTQVPTTTGPPSPVERGYLSYSALRTYQGCPLRYYFKYIVGLPEETVSASLIFGSAIHRAIEHHYREQLAGNAAPPLFDLLREYQLGWTERQEQPVRFNKSEDLTSLNQLAERVLTSFQTYAATEQIGHILAIEETLLGDVIPGLPPLLGRVDLITLQPDALVIHDWKTSRTRWSADQVVESAEQLLLYSTLAAEFAPGLPIQLSFTVLTKTKEPQCDRHTLIAELGQADRLKRIIARVWQAIETEQFYPAPSLPGCASCPYRDPCRSWPG